MEAGVLASRGAPASILEPGCVERQVQHKTVRRACNSSGRFVEDSRE